jgi:hypothetical protein
MTIRDRNVTLGMLMLVTVGALSAGIGCGGGSRSGGTRDQVTGVRGPDGAAATYHDGALPTPMGAVVATVPDAATAINGGSTMITVSSTSTIVKVYVSINGESGYWEVTVPANQTVADVLLTLAQQLPASITLVFEVVDADGNVSPPVTLVTTIVQVKTGDIQVSVSWNVDNDIDLHVVDPNGFEIYYSADISPEGGELDLDSNAGCSIDSVDNENILWPIGKAPHGMYTVRVDNYENCQNTATNYVVTVQKKGQAPQTFMGNFPATDLGDTGGQGDGVMITTFTYP